MNFASSDIRSGDHGGSNVSSGLTSSTPGSSRTQRGMSSSVICPAGAVALAACPLALDRLLVALDLAVGLRPSLRDQEVADAALLKQLAKGAAVCVGPSVVAHESFRLYPVPLEEGECTLGEIDDCGGS